MVCFLALPYDDPMTKNRKKSYSELQSEAEREKQQLARAKAQAERLKPPAEEPAPTAKAPAPKAKKVTRK